MDNPEFKRFPKIPRFSRQAIVTEKIDGTNAVIYINDDMTDLIAGSRTRWLGPGNDNFGFWKWVMDHKDMLLPLGPGYHYGEWWGSGIQRGYDLKEKRFSLFNTTRWDDPTRPECCSIVPVIATGEFSTSLVEEAVEALRREGSFAAPGFMKPEGVIVFHTAGSVLFKKTLEGDEAPKGGKDE